MKDEKEKLEIKKKPQDVKKDELDKIGGGFICTSMDTAFKGMDCHGVSTHKSMC